MDFRDKILEKGKGYVPDKNDDRDFRALAGKPVRERSVDLTPHMLSIRDQGSDSSCVGFAASAMKEYYDNLQRGTQQFFSPRFLYYSCKLKDGIPHLDGTYPRVAMDILKDIGVSFEDLWPYKIGDTKVPRLSKMKKIVRNAETQRIQTYARLYSTRDMVANLLLNGPFLAGVWVTDGWYTDEALRTGLIDHTIGKGKNDGGHAICIVGYDADKKLFKARNSWGTDYGDRGYNYIPRSWMTEFCMDAWSIVDDEAIDNGLIVKEAEGTPERITE